MGGEALCHSTVILAAEDQGIASAHCERSEIRSVC